MCGCAPGSFKVRPASRSRRARRDQAHQDDRAGRRPAVVGDTPAVAADREPLQIFACRTGARHLSRREFANSDAIVSRCPVLDGSEPHAVTIRGLCAREDVGVSISCSRLKSAEINDAILEARGGGMKKIRPGDAGRRARRRTISERADQSPSLKQWPANCQSRATREARGR